VPIALAQISTEDDERPDVHSDEFGSLAHTRASATDPDTGHGDFEHEH